jgi:hypothetical protein
MPLAQAVPATLTLRDFHVDNLMWRAGQQDLARCGLLDFQDAVIGPVAYDLVSLLEDARRDVPEPLIDAMTERYLDAFPRWTAPISPPPPPCCRPSGTARSSASSPGSACAMASRSISNTSRASGAGSNATSPIRRWRR